VERPAPRRECGVRLRVCRVESAHDEAQGRKCNVLAILSGQGALLYSGAGPGRRAQRPRAVCFVEDTRRALHEQEMFHELLVAWRGFPVGEATWEPYSVMAVDVPDMMAKFMECQDDTDMV
jgi:hypothetical protein